MKGNQEEKDINIIHVHEKHTCKQMSRVMTQYPGYTRDCSRGPEAFITLWHAPCGSQVHTATVVQTQYVVPRPLSTAVCKGMCEMCCGSCTICIHARVIYMLYTWCVVTINANIYNVMYNLTRSNDHAMYI